MEFEQYDSTSIPADLFKWCLNLIIEHMEFRHSKSATLPWNKKQKIAELKDPLTRYLVVLDDSKAPVAFASYQLTSEPDLDEKPVPCLYLYELHVVKSSQNSGLGSWLLRKVEEVAHSHRTCCQKIILTCFKALPKNRLYKSPLSFYLKHGFKVDPISPSQCLSAKEASLYDYEILSKPV